MQLDYTAKLVFVLNNQYSSGRHDLNLLSFGQRNLKRCTRPGFAENIYAALVFVNDFRYDSEPQPRSLRLCCEERIKNILQVLRLYSFAMIANKDHHIVI